MHAGSIKPTQDGIGRPKGVWLRGAGLALLLADSGDSGIEPGPTIAPDALFPGPVGGPEGGQMSKEPVAVASVTNQGKPYGVRIDSGGHALRGDEPVAHGGGDTGSTPFGLLLSGLGACTAITLRMYAERKQWPLTGAGVDLSYVVQDRSTRWIDRVITLHGPLDDDQRAKLAEIAEKTPVTKAVRAGTEIRTTVNHA